MSIARAIEPDPGPIRLVPRIDHLWPSRVAFRPEDGDKILVQDGDGNIAVWNIADPASPLCELRIETNAAAAARTADGSAVALGVMDGTVRLWRLDE